MPELLKKQRAFVIAYTGEAKGVGRTAAKLAGYTGTDASLDVTASRLLKSDKVLAEIEKIRLEVEKHIVVDRIARRQILSDFAEDKSLSAKDRMKAIELLGKMSGDFIERRQVDITERKSKEEQKQSQEFINTVNPNDLKKLLDQAYDEEIIN